MVVLLGTRHALSLSLVTLVLCDCHCFGFVRRLSLGPVSVPTHYRYHHGRNAGTPRRMPHAHRPTCTPSLCSTSRPLAQLRCCTPPPWTTRDRSSVSFSFTSSSSPSGAWDGLSDTSPKISLTCFTLGPSAQPSALW